MANPQKENGYIAIANEIFDNLISWNFSSYEWRIILVILRKTYGFQKKKDWISLSQFEEATGIQRPHVCRTIKLLLAQNVITKGGNVNKPLYSIQKDYETWVKLQQGVRSHHSTKGGITKRGSVKGGNKVGLKGVIEVVSKGAHTKDILQKTTTKDILQSEDCGKEINLLMNEFKEINPVINFGNKTQRNALADLLKELGYEKVLAAIKYAVFVQGEQYAPTITTPYQLKNKLGDLRVFHKKNNKSRIIKL